MTNTSRLAGLACPRCGEPGDLCVTASARLYVNDDGYDFAHGCEPSWNDASPASCPVCDYEGVIAEFRDRSQQPEPNVKNDSRARCARYALNAFLSQAGTDADSAVTDLLCNLMHLADRDGTDFDADLARARTHHAQETSAAQPDDLTHSNPDERTRP